MEESNQEEAVQEQWENKTTDRQTKSVLAERQRCCSNVSSKMTGHTDVSSLTTLSIAEITQRQWQAT